MAFAWKLWRLRGDSRRKDRAAWLMSEGMYSLGLTERTFLLMHQWIKVSIAHGWCTCVLHNEWSAPFHPVIVCPQHGQEILNKMESSGGVQ